MDDIKTTCACGELGYYKMKSGHTRKDGTRKIYTRCKLCHARFMRAEMAKRYSTDAGKEKMLESSRKYQQPEKGKAALRRAYIKRKMALSNG
jgi:hypothetical protein